MGDSDGVVTVTVLAFGQLAEHLGGRTHERSLEPGTSIRTLVIELGLQQWIDFGLSVAINGQRCTLDAALGSGDEVALLPPVSGG